MKDRMLRSVLILLAGLVPLGALSAQSPAPGATAPAGTAASGAVAATPGAAASPELRELQAAISETVASARWQNADWGILVASLERGDTLFSMNPDLPLAPASNMKLFSTAAALYYLGPEYRFSTFLLVDGESEAGVLDGDVLLYGTGDPAMSARLLESSRGPLFQFADSLLAHGIREIRGDVVGDGSYFDAAFRGAGWSDSYRLAGYSAPVGALSIAENIVTVRVTPSAETGRAAEIRTVPATSGLAVRNEVRTVASGATRVRFEHDDEAIVITGQIARGHAGVSRTLPVVDPVNFTAAAFRAVLEERGITVHGRVRTIRSPEESRAGGRAAGAENGAPTSAPQVLAVHLSPELREIVNVTNKISQNLYSEALLKSVGRAVFGEGSAAAGARAVAYMLECETDADPASLQIADGSGLSRLNRITPRVTLQLLDFMAREGEATSFHESLPVAAAPDALRHSLRNRLGNTPAARNLRAKTGTISGVSSLAGYVESATGEPLAFVIYSNEVPSTAIAKRIEDAIGRRLATLDRPVAPATTGQLAIGEVAAADATTSETLSSVPASGTTEAGSRPEEPTPAAAPAPSPPGRSHTVRAGDTFDAISRQYGTTVRALQEANPGVDPRRIRPGQTIRVPGG